MFFANISPYDPSRDKWVNITGNAIAKTTIFGGLLDRCFVNNAFSERKSMSGIEYLELVTRDQNVTRMITSLPVRVYYCNGTKPQQEIRASHTLKFRVYRGKEFYVPVTAVDQVNRSVSAFISSNVTSLHAYLGNKQRSQKLTSKCTNLTVNVYSPNENEMLFIFPKDQCNNKDESKILTLQIIFENCTCPVGFHVDKRNQMSCECKCDPKISPYKERCNLSTVIRNSEAQGWLSYDLDTGFLFHPICPHMYNFCLPPAIFVCIDLNLPNGSDTQCVFDRVGLLCGRCKPGYSLSLSSSHCLRCPEINWPWAFLIIMVKIIGGIVLVATILMLNLSISIGTLNGLIFYANVLAVDSSLFLSFTKPNFLTVFIAWLNLDLGFDVCYFKGIDAYSKAWLNILFPTNVITVLILIILISKYSSRFGEFIGKWNPVATLATLLLLSYTKLLRAIITSLSFTVVLYPTGKQETVWLQDASVKFF